MAVDVTNVTKILKKGRGSLSLLRSRSPKDQMVKTSQPAERRKTLQFSLKSRARIGIKVIGHPSQHPPRIRHVGSPFSRRPRLY